jgi:RNA polymerase sigma factor (sigma-70 family)
MQNQHCGGSTACRCQQIADTCMKRYTWELLDLEEFSRRVCGRLAREPELDARCVAVQVYTEALYYACSGTEGRQRQERGYIELHAYLSICAARSYSDVGADATQLAIEKVYRAFDRCRHPDAFLAFALQKLRDACRAELRQVRRELQSLDVFDTDEGKLVGNQRLAMQQADPSEDVLRHELRQEVAQCGQEFLQRHPRASQQLEVLWMKYIDGIDDREISRRLGKPVSSIYVLRARGIAKLRHDSSWLRLARELGLEQAGIITTALAP